MPAAAVRLGGLAVSEASRLPVPAAAVRLGGLAVSVPCCPAPIVQTTIDRHDPALADCSIEAHPARSARASARARWLGGCLRHQAPRFQRRSIRCHSRPRQSCQTSQTGSAVNQRSIHRHSLLRPYRPAAQRKRGCRPSRIDSAADQRSIRRHSLLRPHRPVAQRKRGCRPSRIGSAAARPRLSFRRSGRRSTARSRRRVQKGAARLPPPRGSAASRRPSRSRCRTGALPGRGSEAGLLLRMSDLCPHPAWGERPSMPALHLRRWRFCSDCPPRLSANAARPLRRAYWWISRPRRLCGGAASGSALLLNRLAHRVRQCGTAHGRQIARRTLPRGIAHWKQAALWTRRRGTEGLPADAAPFS